MGPTNSDQAREISPGSIRARLGTDGTQNAVHGSDSRASASREISFFFPDPFPIEKTLAIIKPGVTESNIQEIQKEIQVFDFFFSMELLKKRKKKKKI